MKKLLLPAAVAGAVLILTDACKPKRYTEMSSTKKDTVVVAQEPIKVPGKCDSMHISYTANIKPILDEHCNGCHSAAKRAGGIDLTSYESLKYEASRPRFMGSMRHEEYYSAMPKKAPKLSDSTLAILSCWVEKGAKQ